jgi:hypothetical protein
VQVGEQDVARLQPFPLDLLRFLDLHDHVRPGEHRVGVGDDGRAGLAEGLVGIARALSGARLDDHLMAVGDIFANRRGGQAHPMFARLDLRRNSNAHGHFLPKGFGAANVLLLPLGQARSCRGSPVTGADSCAD